MKPTRIEIEQLAVRFRTFPKSAELAHADVWNAIEAVGGRTAITYGCYLATPLRQRWKKQDLALDVASALDQAAAKLNPAK